MGTPDWLWGLWDAALARVRRRPRVWLILGGGGAFAIVGALYWMTIIGSHERTIELHPGEERCTSVLLAISCLLPREPTYAFLSVEAPSFLDYRTEGVKAVEGVGVSVGRSDVVADVCVRASRVTPPGTYGVKAKYSLDCVFTKSAEVRLDVKVLEPP